MPKPTPVEWAVIAALIFVIGLAVYTSINPTPLVDQQAPQKVEKKGE